MPGFGLWDDWLIGVFFDGQAIGNKTVNFHLQPSIGNKLYLVDIYMNIWIYSHVYYILIWGIPLAPKLVI